MTKLCSKCVHRDVCNELVNNFLKNGAGNCRHFKSATNMIEAPCSIGDTVYYETFAKNGKKHVGMQPHIVTDVSVIITVDSNTKIHASEFGESVFVKVG